MTQARSTAEPAPGPGSTPVRSASSLEPERSLSTRRIVIGAVLTTAVAAVLGAAFGPLAAYGFVGGVFCLLLFITAALVPIFATYGYLITMPILAGIDRGAIIPLVRPNEGLLVVLLGGAMFGAYLRLLRGDQIRPRFYPLVDIPLAVFLLASTVWPLASLTLRLQIPTGIDYASTLPMAKLVAIYFMVRYTITTEQRILRTIRYIVWPGATVALIGILQTLKFGPVLALLQTFWDSSSGAYGSTVDTGGGGGGDAATSAELSERGSATLGSPIAAGDVIIICLILVFCCGARGLLGRRERLVLAMTLGAGTLAAGQFSTWIAAIVAGTLLMRNFPELRRQAKRFMPLFGIAVVVGLPAFLGRLEGIGVESGGLPVPESWYARYDNLAHLFIPHFNWLTTLIGVSPNEALNAPERWRDVVYLESGVLYFLWIGGIPLLAAFIWLSMRVLRAVKPALRHPGPFGASAACLDIVWRFLLIVTLIDPHLQLRGTGDLIFTLLAITVTGLDQRGLSNDRHNPALGYGYPVNPRPS
jgi:hypothetical protein